MELVEAQKPGLVEDRRRGERDHIAVGDFAARDILAEAVDPLMHLGHEFVEMRAALVLDRALLEKTDPSAWSCRARPRHGRRAARRRLVLVGEQPAEQALLAQRLVADSRCSSRAKASAARACAASASIAPEATRL
jgi:hypothetical protein